MADSRRALAIVFGVVFLDLLGFGIIVPILPFYTRSFPGGTEFVIGLLAAGIFFAADVGVQLKGRCRLSNVYRHRCRDMWWR